MRNRPNIVVIVIDTLRRDSLGCFGHAGETSPNIDRLAADGTCFDNLFVNHYPTMPSFTTLYTGVDGIEHQIVRQGVGPLLSPKIPVLAEHLRTAGYTTAAVDNIVTLKHGLPGHFARGYDYYLGYRYEPQKRKQSSYVTDRALAVLEAIRRDPFFLLVHYWDPHTPYWPPEDAPSFDAEPVSPECPTLIEVFQTQGDEATPLLLRSMMMHHVTNYAWVQSQYERSIWNADREVGRLLDGMDTLGLRDNTLVVFLGDHGECFGEFGVHFDHCGPADANLRVPLIMRLPGDVPAGRRTLTFAQTVDVTATILSMAGVAPGTRQLGHSLLDSPRDREFVVAAECTRQSNWILRNRRWKLVLPAVDPRTGAYYPDCMGNPRATPTLHDMEACEWDDVSAAFPAVAETLTAQLREWLESRLQGRPDPLSVQGPNKPIDEFKASWSRVLSERILPG
jgi:arylsulfatase A-like enzyme